MNRFKMEKSVSFKSALVSPNNEKKKTAKNILITNMAENIFRISDEDLISY